jgi:hypothetical protein
VSPHIKFLPSDPHVELVRASELPGWTRAIREAQSGYFAYLEHDWELVGRAMLPVPRTVIGTCTAIHLAGAIRDQYRITRDPTMRPALRALRGGS